MTELHCLHEGIVTEKEIDHLGHMNVRFYAARAMAATRALVARHGLAPQECEEAAVVLAVPDVFTRHHREQLAGAQLAVMTGVLSAEPTELRLHHELVNVGSGEVAATFVHIVGLRHRETRTPRPFAPGLVESAKQAIVEWPEHGRPRTLDLERVPSGLTLDEARTRGIEMREPRTIGADECDADGFFLTEQSPELIWAGEPTRPSIGFPLFESAEGLQVGWATLESRYRLLETPRSGTRIQSFSAEIAISGKTSVSQSWVFDLDRERLTCTSSIVNLAFDIGARQAIPIPDDLRARLEDIYHPDLH